MFLPPQPRYDAGPCRDPTQALMGNRLGVPSSWASGAVVLHRRPQQQANSIREL